MSRFAHAIYSDDIRHEVGNKRSIVGIYSGTLFVPAFPALLPKLCISVSVVTPSSKPFKSMKVRILVDDSVFAEYPVDEQQFIQQQADSVVSEDPDRPRVNEIHLVLQISPFPIEKAILLRTRIVTEEEELKAGGLSPSLTLVKIVWARSIAYVARIRQVALHSRRFAQTMSFFVPPGLGSRANAV